MMKHKLLRRTVIATALALVACSQAAYAENSGLYVGGFAGGISGNVKSTENYSESTYNTMSNTNSHNQLTGAIWGLDVGYDAFLSNYFVLGMEGFVARPDAKAKWESTYSDAQKQFSQTSNSVGLSILPGIQLNHTNRLYSRLGWVQSEFSQQANNTTPYGPNFDHQKSNALEVGLGWLTSLTNKLALRLEYDHSYYNTIKTQNNNVSTSGDFTYRPSVDMFAVGMNYYFTDTMNTPKTQEISSELKTDGFYTGLDAGRSSTNMDFTSTNAGTTTTYPYSLNGYTGNVHVGYRFDITSKFSVAAETFGELTSSKMDYYKDYGPTGTSTITQYKLSEKNSYSLLSVLPGYNITSNSLLYARVGTISTEFERTGDTSSDQGSTNWKKRDSTLLVGMGVEYGVAERVGVVGEYDYAKYSTINVTNGSNSYSYKPETNFYKVGVNYHF